MRRTSVALWCSTFFAAWAGVSWAAWPPEGLQVGPARPWYSDVRIVSDGPGQYVVYDLGHSLSSAVHQAQRFGLDAALGTPWANGEIWWPVADGGSAYFIVNPLGPNPGEATLLRRLGGSTVGAWPYAGVAFDVSSDLTPEASPDRADGAYVASAGADVLLYRFGPDGAPPAGWSAAGLALSVGLPSQGVAPHPRLIADTNGRAVVLFVDEHNDLRVVRVRPDGTLDPTWTTGVLASFPNPGLQPNWWSIAPDAGGYWVTWGTYGTSSALFVARLDGDGAVQTGSPVLALPVASNPEWEPGELVTFPDGAGGFFAFCALGTQANHVAVPVYATHLLGDGTAAPGWSVPGVQLALPGGVPFVLTKVVAGPDRAGGAFFAWDDRITHFTSEYGLAPGWAAGGDVLAFPGLEGNGPCASGGVSFTRQDAILGDDDGLPLVALSVTDNCLGGASGSDVLKLARFVPAVLLGVAPGTMRGPLAVRLAGANPAAGARRFALTLAPDAPAMLRVLDVSGRVVGREFLAPGAATRDVVWSLPGGARAGVYFARLEQRGVSVTARFVALE